MEQGGVRWDVNAISDVDVLPENVYRLEIVDADLTLTGDNSKNPGLLMVKVQLAVKGGDVDGANLWEYMVLGTAEDPMCSQLATFNRPKGGGRRLKKLFVKTGAQSTGDLGTDLAMLKGRQLLGAIKIRPAKGGYDEDNRISEFFAVSERDAPGSRQGMIVGAPAMQAPQGYQHPAQPVQQQYAAPQQAYAPPQGQPQYAPQPQQFVNVPGAQGQFAQPPQYQGAPQQGYAPQGAPQPNGPTPPGISPVPAGGVPPLPSGALPG